jgi:hypothetical protein
MLARASARLRMTLPAQTLGPRRSRSLPAVAESGVSWPAGPGTQTRASSARPEPECPAQPRAASPKAARQPSPATRHEPAASSASRSSPRACRPPPRQAARPGGGRQLHPGHSLAPAVRSRCQVHRPRPRLARPARPDPAQAPAHRRTRTALRQEGPIPRADRRLTIPPPESGSATLRRMLLRAQLGSDFRFGKQGGAAADSRVRPPPESLALAAQVGVDLACGVALEAADDLGWRSAPRRTPGWRHCVELVL